MEPFIYNMEMELTQENVPETRWKPILTSRLPSKTKEFIIDLLAELESTDIDIKSRLLEEFRTSLLMVAMKFFTTFLKVTKPMSHFLSHLPVIFMSHLPDQGHILLETKYVSTMRELYDVCIAVDNLFEHDQQSKHQDPNGKLHTFHCHKYGKAGHKAWECRILQIQAGQKGKQIICCNCSQPGYKSPDCPAKNVKEEPRENSTPKETTHSRSTGQELLHMSK